MILTPQGREIASNDKFPTVQLSLLAICRVAEPIALTSIFPYSWVMVKDMDVANGTDASFYAGILVSAFSLAEALTGMFWGSLSDRVGRKPVLLSGCFGTILSLMVVGLASNFWVALAGRALGGFLNGNIGVIQTMVGELVKKPEHEPRAYAIMPFVWSIGTIVGPAIGGLLVKPTEGFPSVFSPTGLFGRFPYLLPNLVCSVLLLFSIIISCFFLQETHPDMQPWSATEEHHDNDTSPEHPLLATAGATANAGADLRAESYGTFNQVHLQQDINWTVHTDGSKSESAAPKPALFTTRVTMLIAALAIFTYHSMTFDHLFPIFLQDRHVKDNSGFAGGVGLSTRTVGLIMSSDGVIALVIQAVIFPALAEYLGVWKLFVAVTALQPLTYLTVPFLVLLPDSCVFLGIYFCLGARNILSIIEYPVLLILIKQASPSDSVLGKINGLSASAGAAARTLAPPLAGYLYSLGADVGLTALAWWGSAFVAVLGAAQLWFLREKRHAFVTVQPAVRYHSIGGESQALPKEAVHILVTDASTDANRGLAQNGDRMVHSY